MQRMRRDHEPQWLLLPLLELWVDERVLVVGNQMASSLLNGHVVPVRVKAAGSPLYPLPSLTSLAFLVPVVLLYWQLGGPSALLADPNTGVHVQAGEWILSHHAIPRQDVFSFTLAGHAWCDW